MAATCPNVSQTYATYTSGPNTIQVLVNTRTLSTSYVHIPRPTHTHTHTAVQICYTTPPQGRPSGTRTQALTPGLRSRVARELFSVWLSWTPIGWNWTLGLLAFSGRPGWPESIRDFVWAVTHPIQGNKDWLLVGTLHWADKRIVGRHLQHPVGTRERASELVRWTSGSFGHIDEHSVADCTLGRPGPSIIVCFLPLLGLLHLFSRQLPCFREPSRQLGFVVV